MDLLKLIFIKYNVKLRILPELISRLKKFKYLQFPLKKKNAFFFLLVVGPDYN